MGGSSGNLIMRSGRCQLRVQHRLGLGAGSFQGTGAGIGEVSAGTRCGPGSSAWPREYTRRSWLVPLRPEGTSQTSGQEVLCKESATGVGPAL